MLLDEKKINPNLSELYRYFNGKMVRYFNKNGNPKRKYFEEIKCYNCGSRTYISEFKAGNFRHIRCKDCGMIYVNPRFKEAIAHDLYSESDYTEYYKIKLIPAVGYRKKILAANKYKQINEYFDKPGKTLDVGCGLGETLSVFNENGWDCTGIEFNKFAADYASRKFGLHVINKSIFDMTGSPAKSYDLIMLWGVLEHLYDPKKVLRKLRGLLKPGGILVLEVPSADGILVRFVEATSKFVDRIIEGDRHIMLFSLRAFEQMAEKCGFKPLKIVSNGLDIATINRLYLDGAMDNKDVNKLQSALDESYQGDLLRGFFRKGTVKK